LNALRIGKSNSYISSIICSSKNSALDFPKNLSLFKLLSSMQDHPESNDSLCAAHGRQLEVICMDCMKRICTNCALFGDHKNHDIRSEEEIRTETKVKFEYMTEMYEIMD
jgi:hypothetical protein